MKTTDSHMWHVIAENIGVLRKGLGVAVGDGHGPLFRTHKWTRLEALIGLSTGQISPNELSFLVCDYWEEGRG